MEKIMLDQEGLSSSEVPIVNRQVWFRNMDTAVVVIF